MLVGALGVAAGISPTPGSDELRRLRSPVAVAASETGPDLSYQTLSRHPVEDWAAIIDATWGPGASIPEKIRVFDAAWGALDNGYGAFMNLDVDMAELRHRYRSELEDGSLVVLRACPSHPLGLERGDIVLGYDGVPWGELYPLLLEQELPIELGAAWGSTDAAMHHAMLISAGQNWHLFDTIDIVKYDTGETQHLSTGLLRVTPRSGPLCSIWGNEQLPVPGVPMPDFDNRDLVTWGVVEGTRIGYIYVASWSEAAELGISRKFHDAIQTLMQEHDTEGLIIDYRLNTGGYMPVAHAGYSLLFGSPLAAVAFDVRGDPNDHLSMVPHPTFTARLFTIPGDPTTFYARPIAVLTGPGAWSNGDWESLRTALHPRARVFGKPTNGAFTPSDNPFLGAEWHFSRATGSGYLLEGHRYLAHTSAPIDEEVWFTREDVAAGRDTVVAAAIDWIREAGGNE